MNEVKKMLPCKEYFQELKDNIKTMFPDITETKIAIYESWFNEGIRAAREWQPIATAPRDGTDILLTDGETVAQASDWAGEWMLNIGDNKCCHTTWKSLCEPPTHWMPLPPPPTQSARDE